MDVQAVILAAVAALVGLVILALVERWWVHRTIKRIMASITGDGGGASKRAAASDTGEPLRRATF